MTREQYRNVRREVRDNGLYALKWMDAEEQNVAHSIYVPPKDDLAERADLFASMGWCISLSLSIARGIAAERFAAHAYA